jgi:hypothetical protein
MLVSRSCAVVNVRRHAGEPWGTCATFMLTPVKLALTRLVLSLQHVSGGGVKARECFNKSGPMMEGISACQEQGVGVATRRQNRCNVKTTRN